jgi:hypothetical protein
MRAYAPLFAMTQRELGGDGIRSQTHLGPQFGQQGRMSVLYASISAAFAASTSAGQLRRFECVDVDGQRP